MLSLSLLQSDVYIFSTNGQVKVRGAPPSTVLGRQTRARVALLGHVRLHGFVARARRHRALVDRLPHAGRGGRRGLRALVRRKRRHRQGTCWLIGARCQCPDTGKVWDIAPPHVLRAAPDDCTGVSDVLMYALSSFVVLASVSASADAHREDCRQVAMWLVRCLHQLGADTRMVRPLRPFLTSLHSCSLLCVPSMVGLTRNKLLAVSVTQASIYRHSHPIWCRQCIHMVRQT